MSLPQLLSAQTFEIKSIDEVFAHVTPSTLVVLDVDETLLTTSQMLGGDRWFTDQLKQLQHQNFSFEEALAKTLPDYISLQNKTKVKPIEHQAAAVIHTLQKRGHCVIGLTSRSTEIAYVTINQLKTLGIYLQPTAITIPKIEVYSHYPSKYIEGILFSGGLNKGELLYDLMQYAQVNVDRVIFINDKVKYLKQMEDFFEPKNIEFIGLRYGAADASIEAFDPTLAETQKKYFDKILPNDVALKLLHEEL